MSDYLHQIEERIEQATDGPWVNDEVGEVVAPAPFDLYRFDITDTRIARVFESHRDAEFIANARADLPRLLAAIRAVEAVHEPIDALNVRSNRVQKVCTGCGTDDGNWQTWPCPTIRAITNTLEGQK